jgi:hypothetical protein
LQQHIGDEVTIHDKNGETHIYEIADSFVVNPYDNSIKTQTEEEVSEMDMAEIPDDIVETEDDIQLVVSGLSVYVESLNLMDKAHSEQEQTAPIAMVAELNHQYGADVFDAYMKDQKAEPGRTEAAVKSAKEKSKAR